MSASEGKIREALRELRKGSALPPGGACAREESGEGAVLAGPGPVPLGNIRG